MSAGTLHLSGRYQIGDKIGEGGMGLVYRAWDRLRAEWVAIKWMPVNRHTDALHIALAQEFQTLASLRHPHIISVLDYGFDDEGQAFFTMELLETTNTLVSAGRGQPLAEKLRLIKQVLEALVYLHRRSILHLDLKPSNILVVDGQVKVLDFGLANVKHTSNDAFIGTPGYIAPEVYRGERPTEAADLYAVGVMAYELIVGAFPFRRSSAIEIMRETLGTEPDLSSLLSADASAESENEIETLILSERNRPTVLVNNTVFETVLPPAHVPHVPPTSLVEVMKRLMAKHPSQRYGDASTVIRDLNAVTEQPDTNDSSMIRESFLQAAQFVGRDEEIKRLTHGLDAMLQGKGSFWLIAGESGVGKSRLLDEFKIRALVAGALVVRGGASETGISYHLWRDPLSRLVLSCPLSEADASTLQAVIPNIAQLVNHPVVPLAHVEPEERQRRLLAAILDLLKGQKQPVVLILDDLHWLTPENETILKHVTQNIADLKVMVIGSFRDDEGARIGKAFAYAEIIKLPRLSMEAVVSLSESMIGALAHKPAVIDLLKTQSEGNAFFLVETVRALAEDVGRLDRIGTHELPRTILTGGIRELLQRRLRRLSPQQIPLLHLAAVLGTPLDERVLKAAVPDLPFDRWLFDCAEAALLEVRDQRWHFTHDKLREAMTDGFGDDQRRALHRQAAESIEKIYAESAEHAEILALHWRTAGDAVSEMRYTLPAGENAVRRSDYASALGYFERMNTLLQELKPTDVGRQMAVVKLQIGRVHQYLSDYAEAQRLLDESLHIAESLPDMGLTAQALSAMGRVALAQGEYVKATEVLGRSIDLFRQCGDVRGVAEASVTLGQVGLYQGESDKAERYLQEGLVHFRQINDDFSAAYALEALGNLSAQRGSLDEARAYLEQALSLYRKLNNRNGIAGAIMTLGMVSHFGEDYADAAERYHESLNYFRQVGDRSGISACLNNLGHAMLSMKVYDSAKSHFEDSLTISLELNDQWGAANTLSNLGQLDIERGSYAEASGRFKEAARQAAPINAVPLLLEIAVGMARICVLQGDFAQAAELLALPAVHAAANIDVKSNADAMLEEIKGKMAESAFAALVETPLSLDTLVTRMTAA